MNIFDWLILLMIAAAVFFAVRTLRNEKKNGCGKTCAGCPHHCAMEKERK